MNDWKEELKDGWRKIKEGAEKMRLAQRRFTNQEQKVIRDMWTQLRATHRYGQTKEIDTKIGQALHCTSEQARYGRMKMGLKTWGKRKPGRPSLSVQRRVVFQAPVPKKCYCEYCGSRIA